MPVYMITFHTYRSWSEDNPHGHFDRGRHGLKQPDPGLALHRARQATHPPCRFTQSQQQFIIDQLPDLTSRREIRLHTASCTATHVHLVVSWFGKESFFADISEPMGQAKHAANKIKNILATLLSKQAETTGNRWFSRGHDCTPVEDREHLSHLLSVYLPKHRDEGGVVRIYDKGDTTP